MKWNNQWSLHILFFFLLQLTHIWHIYTFAIKHGYNSLRNLYIQNISPWSQDEMNCLPDVHYPPNSKLQTQDIAYSLVMNNLIIGRRFPRISESHKYKNNSEEGIQC